MDYTSPFGDKTLESINPKRVQLCILEVEFEPYRLSEPGLEDCPVRTPQVGGRIVGMDKVSAVAPFQGAVRRVHRDGHAVPA